MMRSKDLQSLQRWRFRGENRPKMGQKNFGDMKNPPRVYGRYLQRCGSAPLPHPLSLDAWAVSQRIEISKPSKGSLLGIGEVLE